VCVVVVVVGGKRVIIEPAARGGEVMWGGGGEMAGGVNAHTPSSHSERNFFLFRDVDQGNGIRRRRRWYNTCIITCSPPPALYPPYCSTSFASPYSMYSHFYQIKEI
jgi:hypothetical protein